MSKYGVFSGPNAGKYGPKQNSVFEHFSRSAGNLFTFTKEILNGKIDFCAMFENTTDTNRSIKKKNILRH